MRPARPLTASGYSGDGARLATARIALGGGLALPAAIARPWSSPRRRCGCCARVGSSTRSTVHETSVLHTGAARPRARLRRAGSACSHSERWRSKAPCLTVLVARPPRRAIALAERASRGRCAGCRGARRAGIAVAVELAPLPLSAIARQRAVDVGLATQSWGGWAFDVARATAIGAALVAGGAALFLWLDEALPAPLVDRHGAAAVAIEVVFVWLAPVRAGAALQPVRRSFRPGAPARTSSRWPTGPAWTWATCWSWTPPAARPPQTPT